MKPLSKEEILLSFPKKFREKISFKYLELDKIDWDNLDFLGWVDPDENLGYLVYPFPQELRGLVLESNQSIGSGGIKMCSFCYTLHLPSGVRLFTYKIPNKKITIGNYFCSDLQCSLYLRKIKLSGITQMSESLSIEEKIERCKRNIEDFFKLIDKKHLL